MILRTLKMVALLLPVLSFVACQDETAEPVEQGKPESDGKVVDGKSDRWNATNNPERFRVSYEYSLEALPLEGEAAQTPWPDTYWPYLEDSTNARWIDPGTLSPMEKYDQAFNGWTPDAEFMKLRPWNTNLCGNAEGWDKAYYEKLGPAAKYQHQRKGFAAAINGIDDDGDGKTDECAVYGDADNADYDGLEGWWGLCHAWAPAAILEPEPQRSVTHNGVTFTPGDIKALLLTIYDKSSALMLGGRCNEKKVERDANGRINLEQCRDTNAGAFHVVASNMLGRYQRAFAEDKTYDYQVWNQPIRSFKVLDMKKGLTAQEAMKYLGQESETYTYNTDAKGFAYVKTKLNYITESNASPEPLLPKIDQYTRSDTYEYILELDAAGKIIGGEWLKYSQTSHPDFLWLPIASGRGANPGINEDNVHMLVQLSTKVEQPPAAGESKTFPSDPAVTPPIPDNDPTGISSVITVADDVAITALKVQVDIEHTYIGDLKVVLERSGKQVVLSDRQGGGTKNLKQGFEVADFNGGSAKGDWALKITDVAAQDSGTLKGWALVVVTGAATPVAPPKEYTFNQQTAIPDNNATGITSTITVPDQGTIHQLTLKLDITHPYIGDLVVSLVHDGAEKVLHSREGGSSDNIKKTYTVDGFGGAQLKGDWQLKVSDQARSDKGNLMSWTLTATVR